MMTDMIFTLLIVLLIGSFIGLLMSAIETIDEYIEFRKFKKLTKQKRIKKERNNNELINPEAVDLFPQLFFNSKATR